MDTQNKQDSPDEKQDVIKAPVQWMVPYRKGQTDRLLYDGDCGLCHNAVKFTLKHDEQGDAFRYTPLQSERVDALLPSDVPKSSLPDSVVIITQQNEVLTKSSAALYMGMRLGGPWRVLATLGYLIPAPVRDGLYDAIALIRHRLFARPKEACPILPPDMRQKFDF